MPNVPFSWRAYSQWTNPVPPRLVTKALQVNPVSSESPYPREGLIKSTYNEWISYLQNHLCNSAFCFIVWDANNILLSLPKYFDSKAQWYKMSTYAHRFCGLGTQGTAGGRLISVGAAWTLELESFETSLTHRCGWCWEDAKIWGLLWPLSPYAHYVVSPAWLLQNRSA